MRLAGRMHEKSNVNTQQQEENGAQPKTVEILGIGIHDVTMDETLNLLRGMVKSGKSHHVSPVNPEMVMAASKNEAFRGVLGKVHLRLPDGMGILLAARLLGRPLRERVTGVDTVKRLARIARQDGLSLFLLGGARGVAEQAAEVLKAENPELRIAGTWSGSPDPEHDEEVCEVVRRTHPDILLVAYGYPKQDFWIARNLQRLEVTVAMSVGGTFDFIAGIRNRAPLWMQRNGLEWLFRLKEEPHRWRRMLALPEFAAAVAKQSIMRSSSY